MSNWNREGVSGEYNPDIGGNVPTYGSDEEVHVNSYADIDSLRRSINTLLAEVRELHHGLEESLISFALPVGTHDPRLVESHRKEWPSNLGEPGENISYRYYKALRLRQTTSAAYIRKRWEEAARGVTGSNAIDILSIAVIIRDETLLIQEFINVHIKDVDDSSEFRLLELFQDWVESALVSVRQFWELFEEREAPEKLLPQNEVGRLTTEEAKQGQAVFKVKLNAHNASVFQDLEFLRKNFAEFAPTFYKKFLGPALNYRLTVGRKALPTGTLLAQEVEDASGTIDDHLRTTLADQMRRVQLFRSKVQKLHNDIGERDKYRNYVQQLVAQGAAIPTSAPNVMTESNESDLEVDYWWEEEQEAVEEPVEGTFTASHAELEDREDDGAHEQYVLRSGDIFSGDIELEPEVLIDGMRPSTHTHTGEDGTKQIDGKYILNNTLTDDVVDPTVAPPRPTDLRVLNFRQYLRPPGVTTVEAEIAWQGQQLYEIQISRIGR